MRRSRLHCFDIDIDRMLTEQGGSIRDQSDALEIDAFDDDGGVADPVVLWRFEASQAGLRFLDRLC